MANAFDSEYSDNIGDLLALFEAPNPGKDKLMAVRRSHFWPQNNPFIESDFQGKIVRGYDFFGRDGDGFIYGVC